MDFLLKGWCDHHANHDKEFRIQKEIKAENAQMAIEQARTYLQQEKEKHQYDVMQVTLFQPIWNLAYVPDQPAIPARAAQPAVKAHFQEQQIGGIITA